MGQCIRPKKEAFVIGCVGAGILDEMTEFVEPWQDTNVYHVLPEGSFTRVAVDVVGSFHE
jgi:hypothetical protein